MSLSDFLAGINLVRRITNERGEPTREFIDFIDQFQRSVNSNAAQTNTDVTAVSDSVTAVDTKVDANNVHGQDVLATWYTDAAGVWPAGNPTKDLTVPFTGTGLGATTSHTVRGTLNSTNGHITITDVSEVGDDTSYSRVDGDGTTTDGHAVITHVASGATGKASFSALDLSGAGGSPGK